MEDIRDVFDLFVRLYPINTIIIINRAIFTSIKTELIENKYKTLNIVLNTNLENNNGRTYAILNNKIEYIYKFNL